MYCYQKVMKAQDIGLGYEILGNVLALAEKYALGKNKNFGFYNMTSAYGDQLLSSFIMNIELLRLSYKYIEFPRNIPKIQVLKEINNWEKSAPENSKKYYKYLSEIISGKYCLPFDYEIKKLKKKMSSLSIEKKVFPFVENEKKIFPLVDTFINFEDYKNYYIDLHEKLSDFFDENYSNLKYDYTYKQTFLNYINSKDIDKKSSIEEWVNKINSGTVQEFIQAYTGETPLCYSLNKWLRECDRDEFDKIKYFAGPFSYSLYRYAHNNPQTKINFSKKFYRKMVLKNHDYIEYKNNIGELICYPAFTSTSEKDMSKYTFPTKLAIDINNIKNDDIYVLLFFDYKCNNSSYPTPCINVSYYSSNSGEKEYIFPPFSFFRIDKVETRSGSSYDPHIIYMTVPNKRVLIEFAIKNKKTINYDKNLNEFYSCN